jgi:hypothetical protein
MARLKRPRDTNQLAALIIGISTGEITDDVPEKVKDPRAVALSKLGASKGGTARGNALTPKRRKAIAKAAAKARWSKR